MSRQETADRLAEVIQQSSDNQLRSISQQLCQLYSYCRIPIPIRRRYTQWLMDHPWAELEPAQVKSLCDELLLQMNQDISIMIREPQLVMEAVELVQARNEFESALSDTRGTFAQTLSRCLDEEERIICGLDIPTKMEEETVARTTVVMNDHKKKLEEIQKGIDLLTSHAENATSNLQCYVQTQEGLKEFRNIFQQNQMQDLNGSRVQIQQQLAQHMSEHTNNLKQYKDTFLSERQSVQQNLRQLFENLKKIHVDILKELQVYKDQQKLHYVRAAEKPEIRDLEDWCAQLGLVTWKLFQKTKCPKFREIISTSDTYLQEKETTATPRIAAEDDAEVESKSVELKEMLGTLLQQSFIVTMQPPDVLKMTNARNKGSSREFQAIVSILGAGCLQVEQVASNVTAGFCAEIDIGNHGQKRSSVSCTLNNNSAPFKVVDGNVSSRRTEACFSDLKVKDFCRGKEGKDTTDDCRVSKQFYRVVFDTKFTLQSEWKFELSTMSLPIIINTGSNQACEALGSLLWYCYNTEDMYTKFPKPFPNELSLDRVLDMLDACIRALSPRKLTEDEKKFLGEKLTGKTAKKPVVAGASCLRPNVTFSQFCVVGLSSKMNYKEKNVEFTFWKWFQAVLNLIHEYLLEPWRDNMIKGFVSKSFVKKKLGNSAPGNFLIRFSESCVMGDHQGVTGGMVVAVKFQDQVIFAPPRTAEHLEKTSLASLLNQFVNKQTGESLLKTLYPNNLPRNLAFQKYSTIRKEKKSNPYYSGYPGWVSLLGISFTAMSINDAPQEDQYNDADIGGAGWVVPSPDSTEHTPSKQQRMGTGSRRKREHSCTSVESDSRSPPSLSQMAAPTKCNIPSFLQGPPTSSSHRGNNIEEQTMSYMRLFGTMNSDPQMQPPMVSNGQTLTQHMPSSRYSLPATSTTTAFGDSQIRQMLQRPNQSPESVDQRQQSPYGSPSSAASCASSQDGTDNCSNYSSDLSEINPSVPFLSLANTSMAGNSAGNDPAADPPVQSGRSYMDLLGEPLEPQLDWIPENYAQ